MAAAPEKIYLDSGNTELLFSPSPEQNSTEYLRSDLAVSAINELVDELRARVAAVGVNHWATVDAKKLIKKYGIRNDTRKDF